MPMAHTRAKQRKLAQEFAQTLTMDTSWNDRWIGDEWNDGWISMSGMTTGVLMNGTKVGNRRMTLPQPHLVGSGLNG